MSRLSFRRSMIALFIGALAATASAAQAVQAQPAAQILKRFHGADGATPQSALFVDASGALYGTTTTGGRFGSGLVFKLTPPKTAGTVWTLTHLYDFCPTGGCAGGTLPLAGLTPDGAGGFFGTTSAGGRHGSGAVFRLRRPAAGATQWLISVIYEFCAEPNCRDGGAPAAALLRGPGNVLYGTTFVGGAHSYGAVFSLSPAAAGHTGRRYAVIHDFDFHDGAGPRGNLALDSAGTLYGTTSAAGANGHGTAFALTPPTAGAAEWRFRVIYQFCAKKACADGADPQSGLLRAQDGALCGTTSNGGSAGWGVVYALLPSSYATLRVLHHFAFSDGAAPVGGLVEQRSGALYGTTSMAGAFGYGTVFKLAPSTFAGWTATVLHDFTGGGGDQPVAGLAIGKGGVLYGTTEFGGGLSDDGVVFAVTP